MDVSFQVSFEEPNAKCAKFGVEIKPKIELEFIGACFF